MAGNPNARIFDIEETLSLSLLSSTTSPNPQDFSGTLTQIHATSNIHFSLASTANIQAKNILQGHTANITSIVFQSSCQWLFTASTDGTIRISDFPGLKCQKEFTNKAGINKAVLHPNQVEILIGDDAGYVKVLDLLKGSFTVEMVIIFKMKQHVFINRFVYFIKKCPEINVPVMSVAISDDGEKLAMINELGNLYIWSSQSAQSASNSFVPLEVIKSAHKPYATKCIFSPNSQ